jgi:hypothetical protein
MEGSAMTDITLWFVRLSSSYESTQQFFSGTDFGIRAMGPQEELL